jgi:hypothetical protein
VNSYCTTTSPVDIPSAGTWYLLLDSAAALANKGNWFHVQAPAAGVAARPAAAAVPAP